MSRMMIGLHHHMSYSPASASQSRLGAGNDHSGNRTNKTKSVDRNNNQEKINATDSGNNLPSRGQRHKQQQLVLSELAEDSIRALRVHKIREERPHHHRTDIVQVSAETVMPTIVVESVPKSRAPAEGKSRSRRREQQTIAHSSSTGRDARHDREPLQVRHQTYCDDDHQGHFLLQHEQQQQRARQNNQVVLIMSDSSSLKGSNCVPIIGRRLPSKSFDHQTSAPNRSDFADSSRLQQASSKPVAGRRSHRLLDQQVERGPLLPYDAASAAHLGPLDIAAGRTVSSERIQMLDGGQPTRWIEHEPTRSARSSSNKQKSHSGRSAIANSNSCSSLAKYSPHLPDPSYITSGQICMDACCREALSAALPVGRFDDGYAESPGGNLSPCTLACCRLDSLANSSSSMRSVGSGSAQTRRLSSRDCNIIVQRDSPVLIHSTCQANGSPLLLAGQRRQNGRKMAPVSVATRRSSSLCRGEELCQTREPSRRLQGRRHAAESLLTTAPHPNPALFPADLAHPLSKQQLPPPPVPSKPSLKHDILALRRELLQQHHLEKLQQLEQEQESSAVTQMYESLAAELKAKLGNPNRAPILLPPKDYDTLSRKQGKLNGIELRRSTNPQLVGPAVARVGPGAGSGTETSAKPRGALNEPPQQQTISEETCCDHSGSSLTNCSSGRATESASLSAGSSPKISANDSARSSGRSSHELDQNYHRELQRAESLQRSRSNSSSGLGSISISAGSPDQIARSSPSHSSGSETDMSTARHMQTDGSLLQATLANDEFIMFGSSLTTRMGTKGDLKGEPAASSAALQKTARAMKDKDSQNEPNCDKSKPSAGRHLWNGRVEVPLKVNNDRPNGNTYLATKQIIY